MITSGLQLYQLDLHEEVPIKDGINSTWAIRVPGGVVYTIMDKSSQVMTSVFVPVNRKVLEEE